MLIHTLFSWLLLLLFASISIAQSVCDGEVQQPLVIPVENVTLQDSLLSRGVAVSAGTPGQNLAFSLISGANNTYVYDGPGLCVNKSYSSPPACAAARGGLFDGGTSSTWAQNITSSSPLIAQEDSQYPITGDLWATDTIHINSSLSIPGFPLGVLENDDYRMNALGLGRNSTLLNTLKTASLIASKTWAVFWGLTGADFRSQMNGNLILGGYDSAKTTGTNYTGPLDYSSGCFAGTQVTLQDISLNLANGSSPSILGASEAKSLRMCIDPSYPIISIPNDVFNLFNHYMSTPYDPNSRTFGLQFYGLLSNASEAYNGNITFSILNGPNVTVSNSQLVVPDLKIDNDGSLTFNASTRVLNLNPQGTINQNDIPVLGLTFLTSAYLMVNYDKDQFTLWQANPTLNEDIVAIGPSSTCTNANSLQTATQTSLPSALPTMISPPSQHRLSRGAKAGIAIGAVAFAALLGLGTIYVLRARQRRQKRDARTFEAVNAVDSEKPFENQSASLFKDLPSEPQELAEPLPHEIGDPQAHEMAA